MALRNTPDSFGLVTRVLHWGMAALVIGMLALGTVIEDMEPGLANLWLYALHKTLGFLVLALILVRTLWHQVSPVPAPLGPPGLAKTAAKAGHLLFYALLLAIPLTGWAGSSATGLDVMIADRWVVPPLVEVSEASEDFWFAAHEILTRLLIGLILIHVLAAVKRQMSGDGTLTRMLRGRV